MKTTYRLTYDNKEYKGNAMEIVAIAEHLDLDSTTIGQALAQIQIGLTNYVAHEMPLAHHQDFHLEITYDNRAHDIINALNGLDDTPKHTLKTCALRIAAITASNAVTQEERSNALLIHNFFLCL